ncbi:ABC transporter ATP-binding protein [Calothrix sp. PCC 6303]|uniref:ABC transporter ATP-binding protein n=1 Tax=Calothrix sp. PCC 6303 TaxID=1170562 RepID=UPI0002A027BE|nr:ABC transporter ATP-binding protein/permease [Calothrix sp. PCC 6303]AFZ01180.1 Xenobiotic-transporting ATPase [Calothrix sp. PCC 6303]
MSNYLKKLLYVLPANKSHLVILVLSFLLVSLMEAFGIGLIGPFINLASNPKVVFENQIVNNIYELTGAIGQNKFIAGIGTIIIITFCLKSYISWKVQTYVFTFSYEQQGKLTSKLLHAYLNAPYVFHLSKSSNYIVQNTVNETKDFSNGILIPLLNSCSNLIISFSLTLLLSLTNFFTVVAILGTVIPVFLLLNNFKDKIKAWGKQASISTESIIRIINHGLGGIKETKVIGCSPYFEQQMLEQEHIYVEAMSGVFGFKLLPRIIIETFLVVFLIGFTSIFLLFNNDIRDLTAVLSVFAIASIRVIPAFSNLAVSMTSLKKHSFTLNKLYNDLKELEKIDKLLDRQYSSSDASRGKELIFDREITLDTLNYRYPNASELALNGVSLKIKKGESVALIGKSGAGKTTLVDVILGLLVPDSGDIKVDGKSIYQDLRSWQNSIGYIPQSIFLTDETIAQNIAFGVSEHLIDKTRLQKVIKTAQLEDLIERLPQGIHTMVGERGVLLSGGQRQRIGIARALYHERQILVLDEATAALDNETESLITEAMQSLSGEKTLIIIAHRLSTIKDCDRVYVLQNGAVLRAGNYQEIVEKENAH